MRTLSLALVALMMVSACSFIYHPSFLNEREQYNEPYLALPPGKKKRKKLIKMVFPSVAFTDALKHYRQEKGFFPADLWNLENYNDQSRAAMNGMREQGFSSMHISYLYLDSMVIDFVHKPVYTVHADIYDLSPDVTGKFIFTMRDSSFFSNTVYNK